MDITGVAHAEQTRNSPSQSGGAVAGFSCAAETSSTPGHLHIKRVTRPHYQTEDELARELEQVTPSNMELLARINRAAIGDLMMDGYARAVRANDGQPEPPIKVDLRNPYRGVDQPMTTDEPPRVTHDMRVGLHVTCEAGGAA